MFEKGIAMPIRGLSPSLSIPAAGVTSPQVSLASLLSTAAHKERSGWLSERAG